VGVARGFVDVAALEPVGLEAVRAVAHERVVREGGERHAPVRVAVALYRAQPLRGGARRRRLAGMALVNPRSHDGAHGHDHS